MSPGLNITVFKTIVLFGLCLFFVSCGSSLFKIGETPGNNKEPDPENPDMSELVQELSLVRQKQSDVDTLLKEKENKIQQLQKKVLILEDKVSLFENKNPGKPTVSLSSNEENTPVGLYKTARDLLINDKYEMALKHFRSFIKQYPKDSLTDNAFYWLGECHYSLENYNRAITVFKKLTQIFSKSEKVPDATLKIGYAYLALNDSNRAHHYLKKVIIRHPFSGAAEKAQEKLGDFQ